MANTQVWQEKKMQETLWPQLLLDDAFIGFLMKKADFALTLNFSWLRVCVCVRSILPPFFFP